MFHSEVYVVYFSLKIKMYTLNYKSIFLPFTVQEEEIPLIVNIWKFVIPAVPRLRDSGLEAVHDGAVLSLMFHKLQKHFVFLVIKSVRGS